MMEILNNLSIEGWQVLQSRIPSGHPLLNDSVNSFLYNKWVMNCISILSKKAPEHATQIRNIYKPEYSLYNIAQQIYAIVMSAVEIINQESKNEDKLLETEKLESAYFNVDFLNKELKERCNSHFSNGNYDEAIMNACKLIEVSIRKLSELPDTDCGVSLVRKAFNKNQPILRYSTITAEQDAMSHLFAGFIGVFKNPQSHRFVDIKDPSTAFEVLMFANHLCKLLDQTQLVPENILPNAKRFKCE
ncbi:MAG: TIGR02391 family protein [Candidatus Eremiobacteraeota bacterium]|nr:TIGR02391 family protein [Candidatus Eremiobacteraeota bacterium]